MDSLLIIRLSALGDVLHTIPAVLELRCAFPATEISWAVEPAYAELVADGRYWDDVSRIDAVRLLLVRTDPGGILPRDRDDLVDGAVYQAIPEAHRFDLATFAFALLAPGDAQRKN